jgi:enolase-phosphatase E1
MDRDRKSTSLKTLQGRIWQQGYARGELVGEVFSDVPLAFQRWNAIGLQIGIFSSGSELAQKLLFRHSSAGDLTTYLHWHFDTTIGPKANPESYRRIAATMAIPLPAIVFVSDSIAELDAAHAAGMRTVLSLRPGNAPVSDHGHRVVRSFDHLIESLRDSKPSGA